MSTNIIESFLCWLKEDGKATATIESYLNNVKQFNNHLTEK